MLTGLGHFTSRNANVNILMKRASFIYFKLCEELGPRPVGSSSLVIII